LTFAEARVTAGSAGIEDNIMTRFTTTNTAPHRMAATDINILSLHAAFQTENNERNMSQKHERFWAMHKLGSSNYRVENGGLKRAEAFERRKAAL